MSNTPEDRFSDEEVRALIARAIELEGGGLTTSAADLRTIASEIGISPQALQIALQEHARSLQLDVKRPSRPAPLTSIAIGVPIGLAAGALLATASPLIGIGVGGLGLMTVGLAASGALVVMAGKHVTIRSFQIRNLLLWTGVTTAGLVTVSLLGTGPLALPGIIVSWCIRSWLASSILGSAAVIAIRRVTGDAHTDTPSHKAEHAVGSRFLSAVKHVAGWFSRTVRRAAHMASAYTASYTRQPE